MSQPIYRFFNDWKFISPFAVAFVTYVINVQAEKKETRKRIRLQRINGQLSKLYGPLYGNRLVNDASYRAVMKEYSNLDNYLKTAHETKNGEMIRQWRVFVTNVLYPLDKEAVDIICNNAELVAEHGHPREFDLLLEHVARLQFVMELWKSKSGKLSHEFDEDDFLEENNASGICFRRDLAEFVQKKCSELRSKQTELELEIDADELTGVALQKMFQKFYR